MDDETQRQLRAEVRSLVRQILPDVLTGVRVESVRLSTDDDLQKFVGRLIALFDDPSSADRVRAGRVRFSLQQVGEPSTDPVEVGHVTEAAAPSASSVRIDKGAVTERVVERAASDGAVLVLGKRAVITPLAREQIRRLGVHVERIR